MAFIKIYYKSIIWAIGLMIVLFTPGNKLPHSRLLNFENADKLIHLVLFMGLCFLLFIDTWTREFSIKFRQVIFIVLSLLLFGISSEIIQHNFIKYRSGSILDFFADLTGILLACGFFYFLRKPISRWCRPTF